MDVLLEALGDGKLCIVDVSQLRGGPALILSGLILRRIFDRNQDEFTKAEPRTIPTIAVIEEAQSVLNEKASASAPFVEWVKEGRKYDLGAVLITQQPGSIPTELLSQGDNWFIFHLLSAVDLQNVRRANAHFSEDLLSVLLNEPIPGQGVFWSSAGSTIYPISLRAFSFEQMIQREDLLYDRPSVATYASTLREKYRAELCETVSGEDVSDETERSTVASHAQVVRTRRGVDVLRAHQGRAIEALQDSGEFAESLKQGGIPWGVVVKILKNALPATMDDRENIAFQLVPKALTTLLGEEGKTWKTERRGSKNTLFVVKTQSPGV
jgi:hypothetical protein